MRIFTLCAFLTLAVLSVPIQADPVADYTNAAQLVSSGSYDAAIQALNKVPDSPDLFLSTQRLLAICFRNKGDFEKAVTIYESLLKGSACSEADKSDLKELLKQSKQASNEKSLSEAEGLVGQKKYDEALDKLKKIDEPVDLTLAALRMSGFCYQSKDDSKNAANCYEKALELKSGSVQIRKEIGQLLAECLFAAKDYEKAIAAYQKLQQEFPELEPDCRLGIGNIFKITGKFDEAAAVFKAALQKETIPADKKKALKIGLAECPYEAGQWDAAIASYTNLLKEYPEQADIWSFIVAASQMNKGDYQAASETLQELVQKHPAADKAKQAYITLHCCLVKLKRTTDAENYLANILTSHPEWKTDPEVLWWLAETYRVDTSDSEKAIKCLDDLVKNNPNSPLTHEAPLIKADILLVNQGKPDDAKQIYQELSGNGTYNASEVAYCLGRCELSKGNWQAAVSEFQKVEPSVDNSFHPAALAQMAEAYIKLADTSNANLKFQELIEKYPDQKITESARQRVAEMQGGVKQ